MSMYPLEVDEFGCYASDRCGEMDVRVVLESDGHAYVEFAVSGRDAHGELDRGRAHVAVIKVTPGTIRDLGAWMLEALGKLEVRRQQLPKEPTP